MGADIAAWALAGAGVTGIGVVLLALRRVPLALAVAYCVAVVAGGALVPSLVDASSEQLVALTAGLFLVGCAGPFLVPTRHRRRSLLSTPRSGSLRTREVSQR